MVKNREINGMGEIALVTPTPGQTADPLDNQLGKSSHQVTPHGPDVE